MALKVGGPALVNAYGLPPISASIRGHDNVQAMIAAVVAAAVGGGPAKRISNGVAPRTSVDELGGQRRLEGFIWNVQPLTPRTVFESQPANRPAAQIVPGAG